MSSVQVQVLNPPPVKTGHTQQKNPVKPMNPNTSKKKNKHDRGSRKRSKSFSGCGIINHKPVLPSKFLLGGNIKDPLNLNSLQDEEINRAMNAVTPKSSPVPTPPRKKGQLEVIIPKNIHDPLNLIDCEDDAEYEQQLCSPVKKKTSEECSHPDEFDRIHESHSTTDDFDLPSPSEPSPPSESKKKRLKKRRTMSGTMELTDVMADVIASTEAKTPESSADSAKIPEIPEFPATVTNVIVTKPKPSTVLTLNVSPAVTTTTDVDTTITTDTTTVATATSTVKVDAAVPATIKKDKTKRKSDEHGHHGLKKFKNNSMDKIVSPVVPQPGAWLKRSNSTIKWPKPRHNKQQDTATPQFKESDKRFQYGNYNRYYGYRNPHNETDYRLKVFSHHPYLFINKDILDVGCNIGHVTLSIARDFGAKSVLGIDIDQKLVSVARKNVKHYVKKEETPPGNEDGQGGGGGGRKTESSEFFPISMPILYGDIDVPGFTHDKSGGFPNNVTFKQCNYILEDDNLLALEQPQFDVILCLSVTKWFHLNWGDAGLKQAFRRMYAQLRPGGKLVLEPQHWASYKSKKKLTSTIYDNYNSIEFFPEKFREYLLSPAVGFAKGEILGYPVHQFKGFRRPIQVFTKSTMFPSERVEATPLNMGISGGRSDSSYRRKTEKYEGHSQGPCIEHVYTDIFDGRYCSCLEDNQEINEKLEDELKKFKGRANAGEEGDSVEVDSEKSGSQEVSPDNT